MRDGKLYWVNGQPPEEGKVTVVTDSSFIRLLDEAVQDFPEPYYDPHDLGYRLNETTALAWFKKWFGVVIEL